MKLEVRCCCHPQRLLGWLDVDPRAVTRGATIRFVIPAFAMRSGDAVSITSAEYVALPVEELGECIDGQPVTRLALKSEETPIEALRRIPGFIEHTAEGEPRHG